MLVMCACDLTLPSLLAGIHGSSVAQEAPTGEAPQAFADDDDATRTAETWKWIDDMFSNG